MIPHPPRRAPALATALLVVSLPGAGSATAREVQVERLFGPEVPTGSYKHPASIEELSSGDLYVVYYGGGGEYAEGTAVFGSRRKQGETSWSSPKPIASNPMHSLGNAVIWQAPDGIVWLFYVVRFGETWSSSRISAKVSKDGGETWSDSFQLTFEEGTMTRGRPIVLVGGDYLLPIYHETGNDPEFTAPDTSSLFLRYEVKKKRWLATNKVRSRQGNLQPAVVQLSDEHLIALCRRGGNYEPSKDGYMVRTESRDGGRTWSAGKEIELPNPNSALDLIRLRSGRLLLVYNDSMSERTPLVAAISTDQGATFPHRRNIAEGPGDFAYPTAIQCRDGKIRVIFTSDERTVVRLAALEEESILQAKSP